MRGLSKENKLIFNSVTGVLNRIVSLVFGMVFRKIFIMYLGESLSGLTSLYSNILNFLNLATVGLGVAAIHKIYLCNANENYEEIQKIEKFTKIFFRGVTIVIFVVGMIFTLFLDKLIYNNAYDISFLRLVFLMQVLSECAVYWFTSKKVILQACEKIYVISIVEIVTNIVMYIAQIAIIVLTQNYLLYLITLIVKYLIIGLSIHRITIKQYPYLKESVSFEWKEMRYLFSDLKDTIFLQISTFVFISTDSLVLSKYLGLVMVNAYDNYMIILNAVTSVVDEINAAIRATFGNKLAKNSGDKEMIAFIQSTTFIQYLLAAFCSSSLYCLMSPFIGLWLGEKFVLSNYMVLLFSVNFFVASLGSPLKNYMTISGEFNRDKKVTFSSAIINLGLSIILAQKIGIAGAILGTLIGNALMLLERTVIFFKCLVGKGFVDYIKNLLKYTICFIISMAVTKYACDMLHLGNSILEFILKMMICVVMPNMINMLLFHKRKEVKELLSLVNRKSHTEN